MSKHGYRGKWIVLEGIDGAGKTTQAKKLARFLLAHPKPRGGGRRHGKRVLLTDEPSHGPIGRFIRDLLHAKMRPKISAELLQTFFVLDRAWHWEHVIASTLRRGVTVISNRNWLSAFVYGGLEGLSMKKISALHRRYFHPTPPISYILRSSNIRNLPRPDAFVVLRVKPEIAFKRLGLRKILRTEFEKFERMKNAARLYDRLGPRFGAVFVDANGSVEDAFLLVREAAIK